MLLDKLRSTWRLGPVNVVRVGLYRMLIRAGLHPVQRLALAPFPGGPFFGSPAPRPRAPTPPGAWSREALLFGRHRLPLEGDAPPRWDANPFTGTAMDGADAPWWTIPDFDETVGDVKAIWEASRMDWAVAFAQRAAAGQPEAAARLEAWLLDWCESNPPYRGPNWKCAQEASIRLLHLALSARLTGTLRKAPAALRWLVEVHLARIEPTVAYALGQQNNHGTSEAAALFVGGGWLAALGDPSGARRAARGRALLERLARRLFLPDGGFSQYSLNYHRLVLDTYALVERLRLDFDAAPFSPGLMERLAAATGWLRAFVDPVTGDAPNYGANDGANLLPLTDAPYRDFRPSVALATAFFEGRRYRAPQGAWVDQLRWLDVEPTGDDVPPAGSAVFRESGQAVLRNGRAAALLVFPCYRFRPGHCDALHVDLWLDGEAVLRDGGTYGYAVEPRWLDHFTGVAGHNTVQFDGRDQMPRLSRFLRGSWLADAEVGPLEQAGGAVALAAAYRDGAGARHERRLSLEPGRLVVRDRLAGFARSAVLRWRLQPGAWRLDGTRLTNGRLTLAVDSTARIVRSALVDGWESLHYLQLSPAPVWEVELAAPGIVTTVCSWQR